MQKPFLNNSFYLIERRIFTQNYKFSNKNDLLAHGGISKKIFVVYVDMVNETLAGVLYGVKYCHQKVHQKISVIITNSFDCIKKIVNFGILIHFLS
jgi:hypothetical protein